MGLSYQDSGVDIEAGERAVELIKKQVESTFSSEVLSGIGGFGGLFQPDLSGCREPVLVSGTDGVGTKLKLAFQLDKHDTVGIDLVAMSVNDILTQGARPLFFLDYLAAGKIEPEKVREIVEGIVTGCQRAGAALLGGETAEMTDFYRPGEYELAGFAVGLVDREKIITGEKIAAGDLLLGLKSNGLHSNGFTLARAALFQQAGYSYDQKLSGLDKNLGLELLRPTRIYVKTVLSLLEKFAIKGIAHVTGGGLKANLSRILPEGLKISLSEKEREIPEIFKIIQEAGDISGREMHRVFNMGTGMVLVISPEERAEILSELEKMQEGFQLLGCIAAGE